MTHAPVVLDLDGSVGPLHGEYRLALQGHQEALRFACGLATLHALVPTLDAQLPAPAAHGTVFMGSGDFHHLSWLLLTRQLRAVPPASKGVRVVVLDNHPDNMRLPWGVHCGSWVRRVALLPKVSHTYVVGITSDDIGWRHSWENQLGPLRAGKLSYWSVGVDTSWSRWLGLAGAFRNFPDMQALIDAFAALLRAQPKPTYLSIDKDVFAPEVVRTNWDQGRLQLPQALALIDALRGQIVGSDVTGEVSSYRYRSAWKRWMSNLDGQDTAVSPDLLASWQAAQHALNERLLACLNAARR